MVSVQSFPRRRESSDNEKIKPDIAGGCDPLQILLVFIAIIEVFEVKCWKSRLMKKIKPDIVRRGAPNYNSGNDSRSYSDR